MPPKASDVVAWADLLANALAAGGSNERLRRYLKGASKTTWDLVNHTVHSKDATRWDASFAVEAVSHMLACYTAAGLRMAAETAVRCVRCDAYVRGPKCEQCGEPNDDYVEPERIGRTEAEIAEALSTPCSLTSDLSTFMRPSGMSRI